MHVHHPLAVLLADDRHAVHAAPGADVAGTGHGLQQGDAVALGGEGAGVPHGAQHRILEVEELKRHQRFPDVPARDDAVAYQGGHLAHLQPLYMELAQYGEVDVAVHIHAVAPGGGRGVLRDRASGVHAEGAAVHVERYGQFGVLAAHGDVQTVVGMHDRLVPDIAGVAVSRLHVLQIDEFLRGGAGAQQEYDRR